MVHVWQHVTIFMLLKSSHMKDLHVFQLLPHTQTLIHIHTDNHHPHAHAHRRRVVTGTPDMKLVISMSYGSTAETGFSKDAVSSLAAKRNDVLWIAAAGNGGDNTTNYPAGYDQVR
jgi:Subtilase family